MSDELEEILAQYKEVSDQFDCYTKKVRAEKLEPSSLSPDLKVLFNHLEIQHNWNEKHNQALAELSMRIINPSISRAWHMLNQIVEEFDKAPINSIKAALQEVIKVLGH